MTGLGKERSDEKAVFEQEVRVSALHLRPELRLQGHLRLQSPGAPLNARSPSPRPEPPSGSGRYSGKEAMMRMLFILSSSLALTLGLRLADPPAASAIQDPATVQAAAKSMVRSGVSRLATLAMDYDPWPRAGY